VSDFNILFANEARRWAVKKIPYRHMGTTEKGCDCTGLIIGVLNKLGKIKKYKLKKYKFDWNIHSGASDIITEELLKIGDFVFDRKIGDLFVFRFGKCNSHVGVFLGGYQFAHSVSHARYCQIGIVKNSMWHKRLTGVIRLNEEKMAQYT